MKYVLYTIFLCVSFSVFGNETETQYHKKITLYSIISNDNFIIFNGNDFGYTHGVVIGGSYLTDSLLTLGLAYSSDLYTKKIKPIKSVVSPSIYFLSNDKIYASFDNYYRAIKNELLFFKILIGYSTIDGHESSNIFSSQNQQKQWHGLIHNFAPEYFPNYKYLDQDITEKYLLLSGSIGKTFTFNQRSKSKLIQSDLIDAFVFYNAFDSFNTSSIGIEGHIYENIIETKNLDVDLNFGVRVQKNFSQNSLKNQFNFGSTLYNDIFSLALMFNKKLTLKNTEEFPYDDSDIITQIIIKIFI